MAEIYDSNLAKELLTILANLDDNFVNKLPTNFLKHLTFIAADASKDFYITKNKNLNEQNISEQCKDVLAFLYYTTLDSENKDFLLNCWNENDISDN